MLSIHQKDYIYSIRSTPGNVESKGMLFMHYLVV